MSATIENVVGLHTMTHDLTSAMGTPGREGMDGTFKTVEHMCLTVQSYLHTFIVFIAAHFAGGGMPFAA
jgi:hypothetical protein